MVSLDLARVTFNRIRINFVWALGYNTLGIPVAAGLLFPFWQIQLPPAAAGLAMAMSSVSVVTSSLMLRNYRPPPGMRPGSPEEQSFGWCSYFARRKAEKNGYKQPQVNELWDPLSTTQRSALYF